MTIRNHHLLLDLLLLDLRRRIDRMGDQAYNAIVLDAYSARLSIKWRYDY